MSARLSQKPYERIVKFDFRLGFDNSTHGFTLLRIITISELLYVNLLALAYR